MWCGVVWCSVALRGVAWRDMLWCGVAWCGVVWCGVAWRGVAWRGVVWCGAVWCGVVRWYMLVWGWVPANTRMLQTVVPCPRCSRRGVGWWRRLPPQPPPLPSKAPANRCLLCSPHYTYHP